MEDIYREKREMRKYTLEEGQKGSSLDNYQVNKRTL